MFATVIALLLLALPLSLDDTAQTNWASMAESGVRRIATKKPLPIYPAESVSKKSSGVAVAAIASGLDGHVASVTILEAPDDAIAAAVREALLSWEIPPTTVIGRPEPYTLRGKVTFYFQIANGRGRVANPEDLPGGPKPEPLSGPPTSPPGVRAGTPAPTVVTGPPPVAPDLEIDETELGRLLAARPSATLLDIRERADFTRAHRDGALNIPRDELNVRAWIEIDRTRPVVIDCSRTETSPCQRAASTLSGMKLAPVLIFVP